LPAETGEKPLHRLVGQVRRDHLGMSRFYYLDVSIAETLRRHATRPQAAEFGADDMRVWYRPRDLLGGISECIIPDTSTLEETTSQILAENKLLDHQNDGNAPASEAASRGA
jgi:hypothetical protein